MHRIVFRLRLDPAERYAYGESDIEKLDVYRTKKSNAPINVYVHGGAWRNGSAKDFAAPAEMFVTAGAHFVVLDFVQIGDAGGDLMPMIQQVQSAVAWVYRNAACFGGDSHRLYITGHSSGHRSRTFQPPPSRAITTTTPGAAATRSIRRSSPGKIER